MESLNQDLLDAQRILAGATLLLPTRAHLQALQEHYRIQLVRVANQLESLRDYVQNLEPGEKS